MKKLPLGKQTFSELIEENNLYIDKTRDIYKLLTGNSKYYFFSRPRRFGKSLLISTLKEIFSGKRELFKDLWIYDKIEWQQYPVIHLDFSAINYQSPDLLQEELNTKLVKIAETYNISLDKKRNYKGNFAELQKTIDFLKSKEAKTAKELLAEKEKNEN